ncbi:class I SAM-dependent methyltransferase [Muriicola sp. Z0-33]|uniref:class I SAM-dependent methyltransferase n=1 Tax=Muriicola sp. Z0-33 TaxID=2816957 RepID=UPI0022379D54|nr:class I SAM-dependent methyltransferase [Muriicola sp. Z0-33]MCW5515240.1 class I SAM-dependent methyltransferase [Muriicola sp. Z0-33]
MKLKLDFFAICLCLLVTFNSNSQYSEDSWKERDEWMNVERLLNWAEVNTGGTVADIGCHEGYLSMHLAKKVGENGKVYAVDVREDRLEKLEDNASERKLQNIVTTLGDYDDPKLPDNSMDVVFVIDAYHEMTEYQTILSHIHESLKPGGRVLILEKLKDHAKNKTRKEQTNSHTLSPKYVKKELKEAGFTITGEYRDIGNWENETGKKIWVLVAVVPEA